MRSAPRVCAAGGSRPVWPSTSVPAKVASVGSAGVSAATSVYLFTHPDVNAFFSGLEGAPRDELRGDIATYLDANPQVKAELQGIRQPLVDMRDRCGGQPLPAS